MSGYCDTVVITGLGAVSPLGGDAKSTWAAMLAAESAAGPLTEPWAEALPVRIAARVRDEPAAGLTRAEGRRVDRSGRFALAAALEAWADAGFAGPAEPGGAPDADRVAVVIGSSLGGAATLIAAHEALRERGARHVSPHTIPMTMPNGPAGLVGLKLGARAAVSCPVSACATGAESIAEGLELIRRGRADVVAAGGAEAAVTPVIIAGFAAMQAMSRRNDDPVRASRPFDRDRDGFVLAEGAAVLILESAEHAARRGARVYCELAGAGISADAFHMTAPEPAGRGMAQALRRALRDAGTDPADVVHVGAHATSTPQGDLAESLAIRSALGEHGYCVSATKSTSGHLLGAAGALAAAATVLMLHERTAAPTANLDALAPEIVLDVVGAEPRPLPRGPVAALSDAAGFGGHNVVLAFRDPPIRR